MASKKRIRSILPLLCGFFALGISACKVSTPPSPLSSPSSCVYSMPAVQTNLQVPGWGTREFDLYLPANYNCSTGADLIVNFHGGSGKKESQELIACPNTDYQSHPNPSDPNCFYNLATQAGFIVAYPNGAPKSTLPIDANLRSFDAGGGGAVPSSSPFFSLGLPFNCVGGLNCLGNGSTPPVDDVEYFRALLSTIQGMAPVKNVFLTGLSDGSAMTHRVACEASDLVKAIAPVSGENQYATSATCSPATPVSVLEIHGTGDPCWPYAGGKLQSCGTPTSGTNGVYIDVATSITGWAQEEGCSLTPNTTNLPVVVVDANHTSVSFSSYPNCHNGASVGLYTVTNGGHTWPDGNQYLTPSLVGYVSENLNASQVILNFFQGISSGH